MTVRDARVERAGTVRRGLLVGCIMGDWRLRDVLESSTDVPRFLVVGVGFEYDSFGLLFPIDSGVGGNCDCERFGGR